MWVGQLRHGSIHSISRYVNWMNIELVNKFSGLGLVTYLETELNIIFYMHLQLIVSNLTLNGI